MYMSGADGTTNRSVAEKFDRIYPDHEPIFHTTVGRLILTFRETGSVLVLWCATYDPPGIWIAIYVQ